MATTIAKDLRVFAGGVKEVPAGVGHASDGYESGIVEASTANNTATVVKAIPVAEGEMVIVRAFGTAVKDDVADTLWTDAVQGFKRAASGNVAAVSTINARTANDSAGAPSITFVANTTDQTVDVTVTGENTKDYEWALRYEVVRNKV